MTNYFKVSYGRPQVAQLFFFESTSRPDTLWNLKLARKAALHCNGTVSVYRSVLAAPLIPQVGSVCPFKALSVLA